jgi:predicted site-specific integrase-resolvase
MPVKRASQNAKSDSVFGHSRKQPKMFRAGLYARVSTNDQQTLPMQLRAMREYAECRGWTIALQVREVNSGAVGGKPARDCWKRPGGGKSMSCWCGVWIAGAAR